MATSQVPVVEDIGWQIDRTTNKTCSLWFWLVFAFTGVFIATGDCIIPIFISLVSHVVMGIFHIEPQTYFRHMHSVAAWKTISSFVGISSPVVVMVEGFPTPCNTQGSTRYWRCAHTFPSFSLQLGTGSSSPLLGPHHRVKRWTVSKRYISFGFVSRMYLTSEKVWGVLVKPHLIVSVIT